MEYLATKYQRKKDPFAENSLPKPFYYPSPTKDIDEHEAIRSPVWNRRKPLDEKSLEDNVQLTTSALPHVQTLNHHGHDLTSLADSYLDETWPNSDKTASFSSTKNDGYSTPAAESPDTRDHQNTIAGIVKNLENISSRHKAAHGDSHKEISESVLKRYIERFRNSDPRPREERLKESEKTKQDFWWLDSSPASNGSKSDANGRSGQKDSRKYDTKVMTEPQTENRLTKEALLAMDEETMKLQLKADRLLSQSKSSLSSGPIVSTEGLGSSIAESEHSVSDVQPPYRPSFVKELRSENPPPFLGPREGMYLHSNKYQASNLQTDDILLRWRLSRKFDSYIHSSQPGASGSVAFASSKYLDPRLEEFRKKLLSQKALVTKEEINFERQRMALLLDDEEFMDKKPPEPSKAEPQFTSDPILERMRKITSSSDFLKPSTGPMLPVMSNPVTLQHHSQDVNSSNAGAKPSYELPTEHVQLGAPDNTNNTASSRAPETNGLISLSGNDVEVDQFKAQVVCDPKEKKYLLYPGDLVTDGGDAVTMVTSAENTYTLPQGSNNIFSNVQVSVEQMRDSGDTGVNGRATDHALVNLSTGTKMPKKQKVDYHKYLEAEKDEGTGMKDRTDKAGQEQGREKLNFVKISSDRDKSQRERSRDANRDISGKKDENYKCKSKPKLKEKIKEQDISSESSDISDKSSCKSNRSVSSSDISEKSSQRSGVSGRSMHKKDISNEKISDSTSLSTANLKHHKSVNGKISSKDGEIKYTASTSSPRNIPETFSSGLKPMESAGFSPLLRFKNPVQAAIGQTIREQMFEGPSLISSVDSWASMFPQSPGPVKSLCESNLASPSMSRTQQESSIHKRLQSTPLSQPCLFDLTEQDGYQSGGEFSEDPLLMMLREQRNNFLKLLEQIEDKLQET